MFTGALHALLRAGAVACLFATALADDAGLVEIRVGWDKYPILDLDPAGLATSKKEPAATAHD